MNLDYLLFSEKTGRDSEIYKSLEEYVFNEYITSSFYINLAYTDQEPFNSVSEFGKYYEDTGDVLVWAEHFKAPHPYLSPEMYGFWRGIHDFYGHYMSYVRSNGLIGEFNLKGEFDAVRIIAETENIDVVEAVIIETVSRNLEGFLRPVSTVGTRELAIRYKEMFG